MTVVKSGDAAGLADLIRRLAEKAPQAVVKGLRESGLMLQAEVQATTSRSKPVPVDVGQYKASWTISPKTDGAWVGNNSLQATFVERGRRAGKTPPSDALVPWVLRHWRDFDIRKKAAVLRKANKKLSKTTSKMMVAKQVAIGLAIAIGKRGIKPRWVLRRALSNVKKRIPTILRKAVQELKP